MNLIIFIIGFILGLEALRVTELLRKIAEKIENVWIELEKNQGKVQFIDPDKFEDKYKMAERVDDILKHG